MNIIILVLGFVVLLPVAIVAYMVVKVVKVTVNEWEKNYKALELKTRKETVKKGIEHREFMNEIVEEVSI